MATPKFMIRFKAPSGQFTISSLKETSTIYDLKKTISQLTGIKLQKIAISNSFPPKPVISSDNASLLEADIRTGDMLVIKIVDNKVMPLVQEDDKASVSEVLVPDVKVPPTATVSSVKIAEVKSLEVQVQGPDVSETPNTNVIEEKASVVAEEQVPIISEESAHIIAEKQASVISEKHIHEVEIPDEFVAALNEGTSLANFLPDMISQSIMMRDEVPSDNSCLFNSLYSILIIGGVPIDNANTLRRIVADKIRSDPRKFNNVILGRGNEEYCAWITNVDNWGGAIELAILSEYFNLEICTICVGTCAMLKFGEQSHFNQRCLLLYDGIHYDPLILHNNEGKLSIFDVTDERPVEMAMELAREARASKQFVDLKNYKLICNDCGLKISGDQQLKLHAASTGHQNFGQID